MDSKEKKPFSKMFPKTLHDFNHVKITVGLWDHLELCDFGNSIYIIFRKETGL